MRLFTSRYGNSRSIKLVDAVPVRTSIGKPRASFHYESVEDLAPFGLLGLSHDLYRPRYLDKLHQLGVDFVRDQLLVAGGGKDVILLCYENLLVPGEWCHRRMIADWWTAQTGEKVVELDDRRPKPRAPKPGLHLLGHKVSKSVFDKARRLIAEGKVSLADKSIDRERFLVKGDTGTRAVIVVDGQPVECDCPSDPNIMCSHRLAVLMLDSSGKLFE